MLKGSVPAGIGHIDRKQNASGLGDRTVVSRSVLLHGKPKRGHRIWRYIEESHWEAVVLKDGEKVKVGG